MPLVIQPSFQVVLTTILLLPEEVVDDVVGDGGVVPVEGLVSAVVLVALEGFASESVEFLIGEQSTLRECGAAFNCLLMSPLTGYFPPISIFSCLASSAEVGQPSSLPI